MALNNNHLENTVILVTREGLGQAEPALSMKVMKTYLSLLLENRTLPGAICFYTEGVKLVAEGSPVLEQLQAMEKQGVHLIVCKTCVDWFSLGDKIRTGVIGGMGDIVAAQCKAAKVITV